MTGREPVAAENVCCGCVRVKFFLCVLLTLALKTGLCTLEKRVCVSLPHLYACAGQQCSLIDGLG